MRDDGYFDERVARRYDDSKDPEFDPDVIRSTVDFLAELAGSGRVLELGIGTGRIAPPLAAPASSAYGIWIPHLASGRAIRPVPIPSSTTPPRRSAEHTR